MDYFTGPADCDGDVKFTLNFYPQGDVKFGGNEISKDETWTTLRLKAESSKNYDTFHHF